MRIRREPDLRNMPTSEIAAYVATKWAGRLLSWGDLETIYGLPERDAEEVFKILSVRNAIQRTISDGGRRTTIYKLRAAE